MIDPVWTGVGFLVSGLLTVLGSSRFQTEDDMFLALVRTGGIVAGMGATVIAGAGSPSDRLVSLGRSLFLIVASCAWLLIAVTFATAVGRAFQENAYGYPWGTWWLSLGLILFFVLAGGWAALQIWNGPTPEVSAGATHRFMTGRSMGSVGAAVFITGLLVVGVLWVFTKPSPASEDGKALKRELDSWVWPKFGVRYEFIGVSESGHGRILGCERSIGDAKGHRTYQHAAYEDPGCCGLLASIRIEDEVRAPGAALRRWASFHSTLDMAAQQQSIHREDGFVRWSLSFERGTLHLDGFRRTEERGSSPEHYWWRHDELGPERDTSLWSVMVEFGLDDRDPRVVRAMLLAQSDRRRSSESIIVSKAAALSELARRWAVEVPLLRRIPPLGPLL